MPVSPRTIGRLSLYRRLVTLLQAQGMKNVYSHQLASMAGSTAAQVRRDLMSVGYSGNPAKGYDIAELIGAIGRILDAPDGQKVALVGVGHLGRALLNYFSARRPKATIEAAFDKDPHKVNRMILGYRALPATQMQEVVRQEGISVAILCVPADEAQRVADDLVDAGIRSIVNFAPVPLKVPSNIYVESMDITMSLEKAAYFARQSDFEKESMEP